MKPQQEELNVGTRTLTAGTVRNASKRTGNQAESWLAINPTNPNNMILHTNKGDGDSGSGIVNHFTTDAGVTWNVSVIANGGALGSACCDSQIAFDRFGNCHMVYLTADVLTAVSTDGGATFNPTGNIALNARYKPISNGRQLGSVDQPSIAVGDNSVWVTFNAGDIIYASGASVTGLGQISAFSTPQSTGGTGNFGHIAVGPNGQVFVVYQNPSGGQGPATIFGNLDPDGLGPQGFGSQIVITSTNVGGFDFIPAQSSRSIDAEANLAWDRSNGPFRGRLYMVYTEETANENNDTDILVRYSNDNGSTWTNPVKVNDDATTNSQFNPGIALDQTTGNVGFGWHDCRLDNGVVGLGSTDTTSNNNPHYFVTVSSDGCATFEPNLRVSAGCSARGGAANGVDYGDYVGLDFTNGILQPSWADNSNTTGDNPNGTLSRFDMYTARVTVAAVIPAPTVTRFAPVASFPGKTITITGTNFIAGQTSVFFGGANLIPAAAVTVVNATTLTVTVPNSGTGTSNINGYLTVRVGANSATTQALPVSINPPCSGSATFPFFIVWGDITGDGLSAQANDVALARAFTQFQATPTSQQMLAADVIPSTPPCRGDGAINTTDITFLRAVSFGQAAF
ncbi:MAG: IPT/TIG domain-containing protein [Blastocatellia bacterium]|nr:IPT/TIG domain-containing protein [Blastocatellia bacterium]